MADERGAIAFEDIAQRLAELKAKRGYLLAHHGLLAVAAPRLLAAYDALYTELALEARDLRLRFPALASTCPRSSASAPTGPPWRPSWTGGAWPRGSSR
jgi:hypothetical protein